MQDPNKGNWTHGYKYWGNRIKAGWDKHGGKICTIAGTTGLFLAGTHACRTTYKHHDDLKKYGEDFAKSKAVIPGEKKFHRCLRIAKSAVICGLKTSKHYIPDILAAGVSTYGVNKGWKYEHDHFEQAATMVGVVTADFMNYRRNVIAEHGKDADRKYMTTKRVDGSNIEAQNADGSMTEVNNVVANSDGITVTLDPNHLKIWYSKETTPSVWSESHVLRLAHLEDIVTGLDLDLIYGGSININDVRRKFYGRKGDVPEGGMFGRIWDPGNPKHPERGRKINLHYQEDQDFMDGLTDSCWIFIDIDEEPLFELLANKKKDRPFDGLFSGQTF